MPNETILVVDDNPANLKLAHLVLTTDGYEAHTAINAEDALQRIQEVKPRLILMDIQMPGMDGLELTRRLKANPETRDIIIVAVTAYAMKGDDARAFAAGCDGYIAKPMDVEALPGEVARYLGVGS